MRRWEWWFKRTAFFEAYLILVVVGWTYTLLFTELFDSNSLYNVMARFAEERTWGALLLGWLGGYGWSYWRMSMRGRTTCLILIVWWWATVTVMIWRASPVSTGVVAYGALAIVSSVAAIHNARHIR